MEQENKYDNVDVEKMAEIQEDETQLAEALDHLGPGDIGEGEKNSLFRFFKHLINKEDTTRISNMREDEIKLVRRDRKVAVLLDAMGQDRVAKYLRERGNAVSETTMGRKGFLVQLAVTQIKQSRIDRGTGEPPKPGLFSSWRKKSNRGGVPEEVPQ